MTEQPHSRTYKIGEVCRMADLQPYVLRYWETEFPALAPTKSGGGQRTYSQREIDIILRIKQLLYSEGFTIAGAKKKLDGELNGKLELVGPAESGGAESASSPAVDRSALQGIRKELNEILDILRR